MLLRDAEERAIDAPAPLTAELHEAMGLLPENQRAAVLYRDVLGLSYDETAAEMGTTVGSVQMLLHRGRNRLRSILAGWSFSGAGFARWLRGTATLAHAPAAQAIAGTTAGLGLALAGGAVALHLANAGHRPAPKISALSGRASFPDGQPARRGVRRARRLGPLSSRDVRRRASMRRRQHRATDAVGDAG